MHPTAQICPKWIISIIDFGTFGADQAHGPNMSQMDHLHNWFCHFRGRSGPWPKHVPNGSFPWLILSLLGPISPMARTCPKWIISIIDLIVMWGRFGPLPKRVPNGSFPYNWVLHFVGSISGPWPIVFLFDLAWIFIDVFYWIWHGFSLICFWFGMDFHLFFFDLPWTLIDFYLIWHGFSLSFMWFGMDFHWFYLIGHGFSLMLHKWYNYDAWGGMCGAIE